MISVVQAEGRPWDEAEPPGVGPRLGEPPPPRPRRPLPQPGAELRHLPPGGGGQPGLQVQGTARPLLRHIPYRQDPTGEQSQSTNQLSPPPPQNKKKMGEKMHD